MNDSAERSPSWLIADGAASISSSMLAAVLINTLPAFSGVWGVKSLEELTHKEDGVIIVASLLLLPTSFAVYGVSRMIFAAKEAVERRALEKGRRAGLQEGILEGRKEGILEERKRVARILKERGIEVPPEIAESIAGDSSA